MSMSEQQYQQIKILFKKQKKFMGSYQNTAPFKEPIAFLKRRNNHIEFYENVKGNEFEFEHSDGETRSIILTTAKIVDFDYGDKTFKGYILDEDTPTPLPEDPLITTELITILIDKTLNDLKKWKAEEWKARGKFFWYILAGIALIIAAYAAYTMFAPPKIPQGTPQVIYNGTKTVIQTINATIIK